MATLSNNHIAQAIFGASKEKEGNDSVAFVNNVTKFLVRKKLISKSSDILKKLEMISNQEAGVLVVKLSSVDFLSEQNKQDIAEILKKNFNAKKILFEEIKDNTLLGGFKIEIDNKIIDLTIFNKLKKLQEHLTR